MNMNKENSNFKSFFSKKESGAERKNNADDYTVKKNKRTDIIIGVLSFLCALVIWAYAVTSGNTTKEFINVSVKIKGSTMITTNGFDPQYSDLKVNFKVQGNISSVNQLSDKNLDIYADLSAINLTDFQDQKIVNLPIVYSVTADGPSGINFFDKSQEFITVTITKKALIPKT